MSTDAVRAALAELVACHTEEAGLTMSMVANRADFDAFMERCDQRLAAALDAARAALSAGDADWQAVPEGYEWALVSGLKPMLAALERAERKGYLPGAMADEWADFDYLPTTPQEPTP